MSDFVSLEGDTFDPGPVLVSVSVLRLFNWNWEKAYILVHRHLKRDYGLVSRSREETNNALLDDKRKRGTIRSLYRVNGWNIVVYTSLSMKLTSVMAEVEKQRWNWK